MGKEVVHKSSHCAWQIHYPIVFPVKYRRALLDEEEVKIITRTAAEISERYDIEFERIGCDRPYRPIVFGASESGAGPNSKGIQKYYGAGDISG